MKMKQIVACAALAAAGISAPAFAGATGNVGAFSEYMFRGVEQSGGAAVQGGLDYSAASGLYAGIWGSNLNIAGGTEVDLYGGFAGKVGEFGYDLGAIYYWYPEEDQVLTNPSINTIEFYAGGSYGPVSAKYFFTNDYYGTDETGTYLNLGLTLPMSPTLNFTSNLGFNGGDGVEKTFGDTYVDYSIGLAKTLDNGFTASFQIIDTDIKVTLPTVGVPPITIDDDPKFVIGLKKTFDL